MDRFIIKSQRNERMQTAIASTSATSEKIIDLNPAPGNDHCIDINAMGQEKQEELSPPLEKKMKSTFSSRLTEKAPSDLGTDSPAQPNISVYPATSFGAKKRCFTQAWYNRFSWIEYSIERDGAFCYPCRKFGIKSSHTDPAFVTSGFKDWKHATGLQGILIKHATSENHKTSTERWSMFLDYKNRGQDVEQILSKISQKQIEENRHFIKTIAEVILLCGEEEMALRGHDENEKSSRPGKFLSILKLLAKHDPILQKKLDDGPNNAKYTSPEIQNEIILIIGQLIKTNILNELKEAIYFTLIVDETKDISHKEQLAIVIRYVLKNQIYERFLGFIHAEKLDAKSLAKYITDEFEALDIDLKLCVSQCYDGASVMSGQKNGVQAHIQKSAPNALYVHCYAHNLNLALIDTTKSVSIVSHFLFLLEELYVFFSSSIIHAIFVEKQNHVYPNMPVRTLKRIVDTRWSCNYDAILVFKTRLAAIIATLEDVVNDGNVRRNVLALGFLQKSVSVDFGSALSLVDSVIHVLSEKRSEIKWNVIWDEVVQLTKEFGINDEHLRHSRHRQMPSKFNDCIVLDTVGQDDTQDINDIDKNNYRKNLYYSVLDFMQEGLKERFSNKSKIMLTGITALLPQSKNFFNFEVVKPLAMHYGLDIDIIKSELKLAQKHFDKSITATNEKTESTNELLEVLVKLEPFKLAYVELYRLVHICCTIGVSSADCERCFSALKRIKTYSRSTMKENRLSSLAILSIERNIAKNLNLDRIVDIFGQKNRRMLLTK